MRPKTKLYPMLSAKEALDQVLAAFEPLPPEPVPLLEALGRVLAEDVYADMDIPPRANTAMHGVAAQTADTTGASPGHPARLRRVHDLAAGYTSEVKVAPWLPFRAETIRRLPDCS